MRRRPDDFSLSLDSFLDIVTNVIGVMILIAILAVISAQNINVSLGTPILHPAPENAERVLFECRHGRVIFIDEKKIDAGITEKLAEYERQNGAWYGEDLPQMFESDDIGDQHYRVGFEPGILGPTQTLRPRTSTEGETIDEINRESSEFRRRIGPLNGREHYVFFVVHQDSYEVFRKAREVVRGQGVETGWIPYNTGEPLRFTSGGGAGGEVQ